MVTSMIIATAAVTWNSLLSQPTTEEELQPYLFVLLQHVINSCFGNILILLIVP